MDWRFWVPFLIALVISAGGVWKLVSSTVERNVVKHIKELETNAAVRLSDSYQNVTNLIVREFEQPRISNTIAQVATLYATNTMAKVISPAVALVRSNLDFAFADFQQRAETNLTQLRALTDLSLTIAKAQSDDRTAFDKLVEMRFSTNEPNSWLAGLAMNELLFRIEVERADRMTLEVNPWEGSKQTAESASMEDYAALLMQSLTLPQRLTLVRQLFSQERFPIESRIGFLVYTMRTSRSIRTLDQAVFLLNSQAKLGKNILAVDQYYTWFEKHQKEQQAKGK